MGCCCGVALPPIGVCLPALAKRVFLLSSQTQKDLRTISTALNILEKYGRNLLNPHKPRFWRTVKFNNPVFRDTVDTIQVREAAAPSPRQIAAHAAVHPLSPLASPPPPPLTTYSAFCQGGRDVLRLYGYSEEQPDGLCFPEQLQEPDTLQVASITVDVMMLRAELNLLLSVGRAAGAKDAGLWKRQGGRDTFWVPAGS